jgi:glucose/arabinose dehydrogenase
MTTVMNVRPRRELYGDRRGTIMCNHLLLAISIGALALPLAACNESSDAAVAEQTFGPSPTLPAPQSSLIPTINVAPATGWPPGGKPAAANGIAVNAFATGLDHPRTVYVLPNGDVLVAESNAPPKPDDGKGIKSWVQKLFMKRAGAVTPSANRITLLRDADNDGVAETKSVFLEKLNSPFGMVLGFLRRQYRCHYEVSLSRGRHQDHRVGRKTGRPAGRHHQPSLDQGSHRQPRRLKVVCDRRLQQQYRRERHRGRSQPRRRSRSRSRQRTIAPVRVRPA